MQTLFKTIHGSRLYGLAHADSDDDYFVVVDKVRTNKKRYAKQSITDGIDTTTLDIGTWLHYCEIGVPQSLEAMFSTKAEIDMLGPLRAQYRAGSGVWSRYLRTIKSFSFEGDFKHRRHALRLALNLRSLARYGHFNPTLDDHQVVIINNLAQGDAEFVYNKAREISWEVY